MINELKARIAYLPTATVGPLQAWVSALTGNVPASDVDVAVMQQFLWQVKRKLFGKPVEWHIMPVLSGPQGSGKSVAVEKLLEPVRAITLTGKSVDFVTDERNYKTLGDHFVCFFDEMSGASKADVEDLKQVISAKTNDYRPLYTNQSAKAMQNCTFIGVSNKDIRDLIRDPSGMRRYYQLATRSYAKDRPAFEEACKIINSIDYVGVWQSVDENQDVAYTRNHVNEIEAHQEVIRSLSSVEEWLVETQLEVGDEARPLTTLYAEYSAFCEASGRRDVINKGNLGREFKAKGFRSSRRSHGMVYFINKKALPLKVVADEA